MTKLLVATTVLAGKLGLAAPAHAAVLDFSGDICSGPCSNYSFIDQSYGDSATVDVRYDRNIATAPLEALSWWDFYSGMPAVAWGDAGATAGIFLAPVAGYSVTLTGLDIGSYLNSNRSSQLTIVDGLGATLFSTGGLGSLAVAAAPVHFDFALTSASGIGIQWGPDAYNVGIDNIAFTTALTSAVPEPATWAMMIGGLGIVGGAMRRRQRVAVRFA